MGTINNELTTRPFINIANLRGHTPGWNYKEHCWATHLRLAVYAIGKHSSFSKTLNGKVSIVLTKLTGCRTSTFHYISLCKTCDYK